MLYIVISASIHGVVVESHSLSESVIFLLPSASASQAASGSSATVCAVLISRGESRFFRLFFHNYIERVDINPTFLFQGNLVFSGTLTMIMVIYGVIHVS